MTQAVMIEAPSARPVGTGIAEFGSLRALGSLSSTDGVVGYAPGRPAAGPYGVVDLFSGCGGLSIGFEIVGRMIPSFRLVGAVELNPHSARTYARNLPVTPIVADIREFAEDPEGARRLRSRLSDHDGPIVVVGGPPCQGFSAHRKKDGPQDPDARNRLVVDFARLSVGMGPELIVMENVPELLSEKNWQLFETFRRILEDAGYHVRAQVHNLAGYGVPQERFRALVIASRSAFDMPEPYLDRQDFRTVRDAIGHLPAVAPGVSSRDDPFHRSAGHHQSTVDVIKQVPLDGGRRPAGVGPACLQRVDGYRDVYGRLYWDRPANTITAYARNPASGRYVHPAQHRGLTIREAALLQGFPPGFVFDGNFDQVFWQIGNAVPPIFSAYLAAQCLGILERAAPRQAVSRHRDIMVPHSNSYSSGIAGRKKGR